MVLSYILTGMTSSKACASSREVEDDDEDVECDREPMVREDRFITYHKLAFGCTLTNKLGPV